MRSNDDVSIRPPLPGDERILIAGRDGEWQRWLGPGSGAPAPTACMLVDNVIVGWVDFDTDRDWLGPGEINVGYNVFAEFRGRGFATRGVLLLLQSLEESGEFHTATVSIAAGNDASLAVASKAGFEVVASTPDGWRLSRPIRLVSTN